MCVCVCECFSLNVLHIGVDTALRAVQPRCSLERTGVGVGGLAGPPPLGGAAQSARRFSFHFHIFVSASMPRCEVSEAPLRDILVVSGRSLTLGSFLLGWARSLDRRRTGPRLPSRPPSPRWQVLVQSLWQRALSRVATSVAAGQRACECLR